MLNLRLHVRWAWGGGARFRSSGSHRQLSGAISIAGEDFARELVARSVCVDLDAKRELLEPLWYGEGRSSERDAWVGLLAEIGGVSRRSRSSPQRFLSFQLAGGDVVEAETELLRLPGYGEGNDQRV